jgi:hypothetical protein
MLCIRATVYILPNYFCAQEKAFYKVSYTNYYHFNIAYKKYNRRVPTCLNTQYCTDIMKAMKMFLLRGFGPHFIIIKKKKVSFETENLRPR